MEPMKKFELTVTCEFSEIEQVFKVWGTDEGNNLKSLMLTMTVEQVKQHLREVIVAKLQEMSQVNMAVFNADSEQTD